MKGYKFKLDAVLKIRKLKEDQCKMEIGRLQVQIKELEALKSQSQEGINQAYASQEEALKNGLNGMEMRFHPYFVEGNRAKINKIEEEIKRVQLEVDEKFEELKKLRADVKVIDEMKTKDQNKYKKALQKKQFEIIEEQVSNWKQSLK